MKILNITIPYFLLLSLCGKIYRQKTTAFSIKKRGKGETCKETNGIVPTLKMKTLPLIKTYNIFSKSNL